MAHDGFSVPYTTKLMSPLQDGQTINLRGHINNDAKSVEVNFLRGHSDLPAAEAILHVKFLFSDKKFVFNSYQQGQWGKEERVSMHVKPGQDYDLRVRALSEHLEIRLNGDKIHEYKNRAPFTMTEYFQVKGDCTLSEVHWGGRVYNLPWETGFANGASMPAGQRIHLYAIPKGDWKLDFIARNGDLLFHWNPRFKENAIVRNSNKNGTWGQEEREGPFPFKKEHGNDITIVNEPYSIQIHVDGHQIGTFQHRCADPVHDYIGFRVDGDVDITNVDFKHP
ncbi:unnamed protein product, partial [Mesorhabditis belari]|uniref:Galectin n=1 Tax=Mesorhabditis belari TaxID=2138241 RepID=A0AAF3E868_9BILA